MKVFNLIRLLFAIALCVGAVFYIKLAAGPTDKSRFIISMNENPDYIVEGDYMGDIQVLDDSITIGESVAFERDTLWNLIQTKYYGKQGNSSAGYGYSPDSSSIELYFQKYLLDLELLGWFPGNHADSGIIKLQRNKTIAWKIALFDRTKRLSIPLLFTDVDSILNKRNLAAYSFLNDTVGIIKYDGDVDYLLSEKSRIILKAKEGIIQKIFPEAKKTDVLDANNSTIYYFDNKVIGNSFAKQSLMTTTINVEMVNPLYNNFLGSIIMDWSITKIIVWTLGTLMAVFLDKLKEKFIVPIAEKIMPFRKGPQKKKRGK